MKSWKKFLLIGAGFGAGFAVLAGILVGGVIWYDSRPQKPKPWNATAILATFEYPDTESGPEAKNGFRPVQLVVYYLNYVRSSPDGEADRGRTRSDVIPGK